MIIKISAIVNKPAVDALLRAYRVMGVDRNKLNPAAFNGDKAKVFKGLESGGVLEELVQSVAARRKRLLDLQSGGIKDEKKNLYEIYSAEILRRIPGISDEEKNRLVRRVQRYRDHHPGSSVEEAIKISLERKDKINIESNFRRIYTEKFPDASEEQIKKDLMKFRNFKFVRKISDLGEALEKFFIMLSGGEEKPKSLKQMIRERFPEKSEEEIIKIYQNLVARKYRSGGTNEQLINGYVNRSQRTRGNIVKNFDIKELPSDVRKSISDWCKEKNIRPTIFSRLYNQIGSISRVKEILESSGGTYSSNLEIPVTSIEHEGLESNPIVFFDGNRYYLKRLISRLFPKDRFAPKEVAIAYTVIMDYHFGNPKHGIHDADPISIDEAIDKAYRIIRVYRYEKELDKLYGDFSEFANKILEEHHVTENLSFEESVSKMKEEMKELSGIGDEEVVAFSDKMVRIALVLEENCNWKISDKFFNYILKKL